MLSDLVTPVLQTLNKKPQKTHRKYGAGMSVCTLIGLIVLPLVPVVLFWYVGWLSEKLCGGPWTPAIADWWRFHSWWFGCCGCGFDEKLFPSPRLMLGYCTNWDCSSGISTFKKEEKRIDYWRVGNWCETCKWKLQMYSDRQQQHTWLLVWRFHGNCLRDIVVETLTINSFNRLPWLPHSAYLATVEH